MPDFPLRAPASWYTASPAGSPLARFVCDLIAAECRRMRPGRAALPVATPWPLDLRLDDDLGLDSLECLSIATALSETLHLHESGLEDLLLVHRGLGDWIDLATRSLEQFDDRLTFRTSGSSGVPKPCTHELAHLTREAGHWATTLAGTRRILSAVPSHHIYGFLFTLALPAHWPDVAVVDVRHHTPQALAREWGEGDLVVGHPAFWTLAARHLTTIPAGVCGVTSTAPCPDEVAVALHRAGLGRLLQVYGSSETAGIAWRQSPAEPFRLLPYWERDRADPPAGTPPEADIVFATNGSGITRAVLQDRLAWVDESAFDVLGRVDSAVQVAGTNVFPSRVREVLCQHPWVADAAVRLMSAHEGMRLKAFVVPRQDCDASPEALRSDLDAWVHARLSAVELPRAFNFGRALPVGDSGKPADWPLPDPA